MNSLPKLPARVAYLFLDNARKRNALSLAVIRDLTAQLRNHLTSPHTGEVLTLPPFQPTLLPELAKPTSPHHWLANTASYNLHRSGLPRVVVLRSSGPVFSSGHDLRELHETHTSLDARAALFAECAALMDLIRHSPAPVICAVQGLATAAGCQLALAADITVARPSAKFQLPGMTVGLPCTSPVTAVSRCVPLPLAYRMFATAEAVPAMLLGGAVDVVAEDADEALQKRVAELVERIATLPGQPQAFGKWAFWTQAGLVGSSGSSGDGFQEATRWAGEAMALHLQSEEAGEGMQAFLGKREPTWSS